MSIENFQSFKSKNLTNENVKQHTQSTKTLITQKVPTLHFSFTANKENSFSNNYLPNRCPTSPKKLKNDLSLKSFPQNSSVISTINLQSPPKHIKGEEENENEEENITPLTEKFNGNEKRETQLDKVKMTHKPSMSIVVEDLSKYTGETNSIDDKSEKKTAIPFRKNISVTTTRQVLTEVKTTGVDMKGNGKFVKTEKIVGHSGIETVKETIEEKPQFDDTFGVLYRSRKIGYLNEKPKYRWDGGYKEEAVHNYKVRRDLRSSIFQGERRFGVKENEANKSHQAVFYS